MGRELLSQHEIETVQGSTIAERKSPVVEDLPVAVLEGAWEEIAGHWARVMSGILRADVRLQLQMVSRTRLGAFLLTCGEPTCLAYLADDDGPVPGVIEIPLFVVYPMLNRILGGDLDDRTVQRRPLTELEQRLVTRMLDTMLAGSSDNAPQGHEPLRVCRVECRTTDWESRDLRQPLIAIDFRIGWAGVEGPLRLALETRLLDRAVMHGRTVPETPECQPEPDVELRVVLATSRIDAEELTDLQIGDILETETGVEDLLAVEIDGQPAFLGRVGECDGKKAIRIDRPV